MTTRFPRELSRILIVCVAAGCEHGSTSAVPIAVEPRLIALSMLPQWKASAGPEICPPVTEPCNTFSTIRFAAKAGTGTVLGNGRQLVQVDSDGSNARTVAHLGSGPGEYKAILAVDGTEKHFTIFDPANGRITTYDIHGATKHMTTVPPLPAIVRAASLADDELYLLLADPRGGAKGTIAKFQDGYAAFDTIVSIGFPPFSPAGDEGFQIAPFFSAQPLMAVTPGGGVVYSRGADYDVTAFDSEGHEQFRFMVQTPKVRVTRADVDREAQRRAGGGNLPGAREQLDEAAKMAADTFPSIDRIQVLEDGSIWVRRYITPSMKQAQWDIFSSIGEPKGTLSLSLTARVLRGSMAAVLTMESDSLGVPHLTWNDVAPVLSSESK